MAVALDLPPWLATLAAMGVGLVVSVAGTRAVVRRLDAAGNSVGEPIEVDLARPKTPQAEPLPPRGVDPDPPWPGGGLADVIPGKPPAAPDIPSIRPPDPPPPPRLLPEPDPAPITPEKPKTKPRPESGPTPPHEFSSNLKDHLTTVEGMNREGISGGHNFKNFENYFNELFRGRKIGGLEFDLYRNVIISKTEIYPGVYEIMYKVPKLQSGGRLPDKITWREVDKPKTVYDPAVISDETMLEYAMEAMRNAHPVSEGSSRYVGIFNNMMFEGWLNNGKFTSIYPVDPSNYPMFPLQ
jgi:hypothetical protein